MVHCVAMAYSDICLTKTANHASMSCTTSLEGGEQKTYKHVMHMRDGNVSKLSLSRLYSMIVSIQLEPYFYSFRLRTTVISFIRIQN
ncbi:hypothetical protein SDJN02_23870, partial [Cucurbita argyrosperma subsp. argyrosperma]